MTPKAIEAARHEPITHELKTDPEVFQAICDGRDVKDESVSVEPWHTIRQRLLALVEKPAHDSDRIKKLEQCLLGYVRAAGRMLDGWAETNDAGKNDLWKNLHALEVPARELLGDAVCFGLSETPAPAVDVDALLSEAEDYAKTSVMRGMGSASTSANWICRLATALRESRAREVAVGTHECPHAAAIKDRIERQKTLPEGTYADQRDDTDKDCGYLLNKTYEMRREINYLKAQRDAAIARAERAEAERDAAQHDVKEVAGIFKIVMPRPGTDIAKICLKNAALKRERDALAADLAAARAELGALGKKAQQGCLS